VTNVVFVGSGDAFGSGGRRQTCIGLTGDDQFMLVDCGTTSILGLKALGLDPSLVSAVVISHLHGDHFGGLPFLILDGQFSGRTRPLVVAGPPGTRDRLTQAMEVLFPGSSQVRRRFEVEVRELALDGSPQPAGAATVRGWEVEHARGAPPLAVRVDLGGVSVGYSGDTQWTPALVHAARDADLFAAEAYTFDQPVRYHLDYATLRAHLTELDARQLILTHMSSDLLSHLDEVDLPTAHDGLAIDL
jgi:ribonuclease BN (tRNA processing enzyme)